MYFMLYITCQYKDYDIRIVNHPENKFVWGIIADDLRKAVGQKVVCLKEWQDYLLIEGDSVPFSVFWEPGVHQIFHKYPTIKVKRFRDWLLEMLPTFCVIQECPDGKGDRKSLGIEDIINLADTAAAIDHLSSGEIKSKLESLLKRELGRKQWVTLPERMEQLGIPLINKRLSVQSFVGDGHLSFSDQNGDIYYELTTQLDRAIYQYLMQ